MIRLYDENEIYLNLFVLFRISADTTKFQLWCRSRYSFVSTFYSVKTCSVFFFTHVITRT
jgi:hypothetical protein